MANVCRPPSMRLIGRGRVSVLDILVTLDASFVVNLGTWQGYSALDVVRALEKISERPVSYGIVGRRPGDVASCYADPSAAEKVLGWRAEFGIERMCADHWRWQSMNPRGFA